MWQFKFIKTTMFKKSSLWIFDKNLSTGSYELVLKLNNDENKETIITIRELEFFDESEGELFLNPLGRFKDLKRKEIITGEVDLSSIKIKYLGEK